jgi:hypothetical protein
LIAPPRATAAAWLRAAGKDWTEIDVSARAGHPARFMLPASLTTGDPIVAVNDLTVKRDRFGPIAIGIWSRFAHPRQRSAALVGDPREGTTAEIALAVSPALILLRGSLNERPLLIAASDQIAAELAGRALLDLRDADWNPEPIGPWEDPLVQRATELGLGVRIPSDIRAACVWLGGEDAPHRADFFAFSAELLGRIGVLAAS